MKTISELNKEILETTICIQDKYPELANFIGEMPETIPDMAAPAINPTTLMEYSDSLKSLVSKYAKNHKI